MNIDFLSLIIASILATIGALLIALKNVKNKAERLQREKDVSIIKAEAKAEIDHTHLDSLVTKLNRKMSDDRRGN